MDRRAADPAEVAVQPADQAVDLVAQPAVLLDPLPRRGGHLHEDGVLDGDLAVAHQLAEGPQPVVDALGVVEPVDAEQHLARVAELLADLLGPLRRPTPSGPARRGPAVSIEIGNEPACTTRPSGR